MNELQGNKFLLGFLELNNIDSSSPSVCKRDMANVYEEMTVPFRKDLIWIRSEWLAGASNAWRVLRSWGEGQTIGQDTSSGDGLSSPPPQIGCEGDLAATTPNWVTCKKTVPI